MKKKILFFLIFINLYFQALSQNNEDVISQVDSLIRFDLGFQIKTQDSIEDESSEGANLSKNKGLTCNVSLPSDVNTPPIILLNGQIVKKEELKILSMNKVHAIKSMQ